MKTKTIKKVIESKVKSWLESISDEMKENPLLEEAFGKNFVEEIEKDIIVTGGCIVSMLLQEEPNDYDIYFKTKEIAAKVAKFYVKQRGEVSETDKGIEIFIISNGIIKCEEKVKYTVATITGNAISLHGDIQLITRFTGEPDEIHKNFDYRHTKSYWHDDKLVLNPLALESIITKELRYDGSLYPVCSIFRMKKFIQRGWTITAGEILKMIYDCNKLNLSDIKVLKEQLIGVDTSYFMDMIEKLENASEINDFRDYLFELIDEVFN